MGGEGTDRQESRHSRERDIDLFGDGQAWKDRDAVPLEELQAVSGVRVLS
jgi:hypothetical protein